MEKEQHLTSMLAHVKRKRGANLSYDFYRILENWHCLAIRELARLPNFTSNPTEISIRMKGLLSIADAKRAINNLVDAGILRQSTDGNLIATSQALRTSDEINSLAIRKYHKSCLDLGKRILETEPIEEREFGSISIPLETKDRDKLKDLIKDFRERVIALAPADLTGDVRVTQVNIQMFHLSK